MAPNVLLEVTIPEGSHQGSKITVQCPNGKYFEFIVPDNVNPGDVVNVLVPDDKVPIIASDGTDVGVPAVTDGANQNGPTTGDSKHLPRVAALATVSRLNFPYLHSTYYMRMVIVFGQFVA